MSTQFKDKVALVTGSSFGIGKAAAMLFAEKGAKVVLADWIEDNDVFNAIKSFGGEAYFIKCDVSNEIAVKNMIDKTIKKLGESIEVAEAAVWLCSDAASFITGHSLVVDGGWTVQ